MKPVFLTDVYIWRASQNLGHCYLLHHRSLRLVRDDRNPLSESAEFKANHNIRMQHNGEQNCWNSQRPTMSHQLHWGIGTRFLLLGFSSEGRIPLAGHREFATKLYRNLQKIRLKRSNQTQSYADMGIIMITLKAKAVLTCTTLDEGHGVQTRRGRNPDLLLHLEFQAWPEKHEDRPVAFADEEWAKRD